MKKPTDTELAILNILWRKGPQSVRQVHETLEAQKDVFYTTTLKTMQVMLEKGFLQRDTSQRSHIYSATLKQKDTQSTLLKKLADMLFEGSTSQLIISALGQSKPSEEEMKEIQSLLKKNRGQ